MQIVLPGRSEPLIPHSLPADDAHLLKNPQILEIHSLPYDIAHLLEIHNQPFSTFVPSPLNQNIFLEDMLKKKTYFCQLSSENNCWCFRIQNLQIAGQPRVNPLAQHSQSILTQDSRHLMTLPFPKAFRRLTLTPISHQTCCFLWLQETFLLFQQGQPPSFLWKCFTYCQPSLSAAQPATLAFLFSNIIFFPEFLSNPKFSQGRTALSKIKKIQV